MPQSIHFATPRSPCDGNYRNSSTNDYTVKAIIQYAQTPLPPGSKLSNPIIDLYRKLSSGDLEPITSAISIRYCFDDDVLIVEFDRSEVADYLSDEKVRGFIDVVVKGEFTLTTDTVFGVTASLTETIIEFEEEGQLLSTSPTKGRFYGLPWKCAIMPGSRQFNQKISERRRILIDRREFIYSAHIPERRCFPDRRFQKDRRKAGRRPPAGRPGHSSTHGSIIIPFPTQRTGD